MMNGHESYLVRIMIKVMIMVTIKINLMNFEIPESTLEEKTV